MDPIIIGSIIGFIGTMLAPIITLMVKTWFDNRKLVRLSASRHTAIEGRWTGAITYDRSMQYKDISIPVEACFSIRGKVVKGSVEYEYEDTGEKVTLVLQGGFYDQSFMKCDYQNKDSRVFQFGTIILELSPDALSLSGVLQGFGRITRGWVSSNIELRKK